MKVSLFSLIISVFIITQIQAQLYSEVASEKGINGGFGSGTFGGGISFCDFNNDGWDDLSFASQSGDDLFFYQNNNGNFQLLSPLVENKDEVKQILWVDYDNDGDKDLFVTGFMAPNRLYKNDGNLQLTEVTVEAGLPLSNDPTFGAAFGDYNKDGWLDLYVVNRNNTAAITNHLYRNKKDGTFEDVSVASATDDPFKLPFCASFFDMNNNGWQDIYISSDRVGVENTLLKNLQNGQFTDISIGSGSNVAIDAMNVGLGDYDFDGDLDIYVTNTAGAGGSVLLQNNGNETFTDVTASSGATYLITAWGGNFFDYDNDMDEDIYVCSGLPGSDQSSRLFQNLGDGTFNQPDPNGWVGDTVSSFCNVIGDINNDGFPDIAVSNGAPAPFMLWQNNLSINSHWLKIELVGVESNRDGIGSWIEVFTNGKKQVRYTYCGIAFLGQNSNKQHFGLGNSSIVDSIHIKWLSGHIDRLYDVTSKQVLEVVEFSTNCPENIHINNNPIPARTYTASSSITAEGVIETTTPTNFKAANNISLLAGFFAPVGSDFIATIESCNNSNNRGIESYKAYLPNTKVLNQNENNLEVFPNPVNSNANIFYTLAQDDNISLEVFNINGQRIASLIKHGFYKAGTIQEKYNFEHLEDGIYFFQLKTSLNTITKKVFVSK